MKTNLLFLAVVVALISFVQAEDGSATALSKKDKVESQPFYKRAWNAIPSFFNFSKKEPVGFENLKPLDQVDQNYTLQQANSPVSAASQNAVDAQTAAASAQTNTANVPAANATANANATGDDNNSQAATTKKDNSQTDKKAGDKKKTDAKKDGDKNKTDAKKDGDKKKIDAKKDNSNKQDNEVSTSSDDEKESEGCCSISRTLKIVGVIAAIVVVLIIAVAVYKKYESDRNGV